MTGQILEAVKDARSEKLLSLDERLSNEYRQKYIGKKVTVLFEEEAVIGGKNYIVGFTDTYVKVAVASEKIRSNDICDVIITDLIGKDMVIGVAEN